jgi:hypothetical protein
MSACVFDMFIALKHKIRGARKATNPFKNSPAHASIVIATCP